MTKSESARNECPRSVVLLAAGQGSRLHPLTEKCPKSLLRMGDHTIMETILNPLLETGPREIVVVTGFEHDQMTNFLSEKFGDRNVRTARNFDYLKDTNILSAQIGVSALENSETGYFIIETDIIATPAVWKSIIEQEGRLGSYWVTCGVYGPELTGGIVNTGADRAVTDIRYEPTYDSRFDSWPKMIGVLSVGPEQVADDIATRSELIKQSIAQYYMAPWITYSERLPCQAFDLGSQFAISFNTQTEYEAARRAFEVHMGKISE